MNSSHHKVYRLRIEGIVLCVLLCVCCNAQDLHFSIPSSAPLQINPALTGSHKADYRFMSAYKNQWASVGTPFQTIYGSFDMKLFNTNEGHNHLGSGISFFSDKAGKTSMGLTQLNLHVAYQYKIGDKQFLACGIQAGYIQRSASYEGIKWDNQYDGIGYDPALPSGETNLLQNSNYLDAGAGVTWEYVPNNKLKAKVGWAAYHLTMSNGSYFEGNTDQQKLRMVLHGEGELKLHKEFSLIPQFVSMIKGPSVEINVGGFVKYVTGERSKYTDATIPSTLSLGGFYRYDDAIIVGLLYEYRQLVSIGFSYDLNISPLRVATSVKGGMEITLLIHGLFESKVINLKQKRSLL